MELTPFITNTINQLNGQGKGVALEYFKPFIPDITRQKLSAWKKTGKYPFEIAEAVFANEFTDDGQERVADDLPPEKSQTDPRTLHPIVAVQESAPAGAEIDDLNEDGTLASDAQPVGVGYPMRAGAGVMGRHNDIAVRPARERGRTAPGPEITPSPIDPRTVAMITQQVLEALGHAPVVPTPVRRGNAAPVESRRPRLMGRNWNEPRRPAAPRGA